MPDPTLPSPPPLAAFLASLLPKGGAVPTARKPSPPPPRQLQGENPGRQGLDRLVVFCDRWRALSPL